MVGGWWFEGLGEGGKAAAHIAARGKPSVECATHIQRSCSGTLTDKGCGLGSSSALVETRTADYLEQSKKTLAI